MAAAWLKLQPFVRREVSPRKAAFAWPLDTNSTRTKTMTSSLWTSRATPLAPLRIADPLHPHTWIQGISTAMGGGNSRSHFTEVAVQHKVTPVNGRGSERVSRHLLQELRRSH